ncbi:hypothetical protein BGX38DRAFT_1145695 [Terfezia claveryi]|nr:hypothetical protein BGX38DRAFT_1145695 [Terfezia claveryi]
MDGLEMGSSGMCGMGMGGMGMSGMEMGGPGMGGPGMGGSGMSVSGMGLYEGFSHGSTSGPINPVGIGYYTRNWQSPMYKIPVDGFQNPAGFGAWGGSDSPSSLIMENIKHVNTAKEQVVRAEVGAMSRAESVESGMMRSEPVGVSPLLEAVNAKSVIKVAGVKDMVIIEVDALVQVVEQNLEEDIGNVEPVKERGSKRVRESLASMRVNMEDKVGTDPNIENNLKGRGEGNGKLEPKADSKKKLLEHAKRLATNWNNDTIEDDNLILAQ